MKQKIMIIVPCYNEEETIHKYYDEVVKIFDDKYDYSVIFVNDGSKDNTLNILRALADTDNRMKYVSLSRNFGKESAMYAGLETAYKAGCDAAIIMDVDLQDPPRIIPQLIEAHEEGYNLIYTKHKNRRGSFLYNTFALTFYKLFAFITKDNGLKEGARDFCLLDRKAVKAFLDIKDFERFTKGIYHYVGFKTKCIEFDYQERSAGTTKWNFKKLFHYALLGIREFSRFYEYIPKIFAVLTFLLLCYDVSFGIYNVVANNAAFPWSDVRLDIFMFAIFISIFYVCRLIYEVRNHVQNRPLYILEETNVEIED